MARPKESTPEKIYEIVRGGKKGKLRVTIPASWRVTYGPVIPGVQMKSKYEDAGLCLRFWEGKDNQRAMFTDVVEFRDLSIKTMIEHISETGQHSWTSCEEHSERREVIRKHKEWKDGNG